MLKAIKNQLFGSLDRLLWSGGLRILMYHGFCDGDHGLINASGKHVERVQFKRQLSELLRQQWYPVSLEEIHRFLNGEQELPPFSFMVTFDDGYASNFEVAFPVLKELGVPAVIFVATDFVDDGRPLWPDRVEYAIAYSSRRHLKWYDSHDSRVVSLGNLQERENAIHDIKRRLKRMPEEQRDHSLSSIENSLDIELDPRRAPLPYRALTWDQCQHMGESGLVEFGAHTMSHPILSRCSTRQARQEIFESKRLVELRTGQDCKTFAYPNGGVNDFSEESCNLVQEAGFDSAMTTVNGLNTQQTDRFRLMRFGVNNHLNPPDLAALLQVSRSRAATMASAIAVRR